LVLGLEVLARQQGLSSSNWWQHTLTRGSKYQQLLLASS